MSALYLDSSAFVRAVVNEPGSDSLRRYLKQKRGEHVSSALLRAEALRAVRHLGPDGLSTVREGLRRVALIAIDDRILDAAGILDPGIVRTLDAIHLATALAVGDDLESVVTYDQRMIDAAALLGLPAISPA